MEKLASPTQQISNLQDQVANLQEKLQKQEKMASLGLLSAGIAHEVQNPLNFVINFSKLSVNLLDDLQDIVEENMARLNQDDADDLSDIANDLKKNLQKIQEHSQRAISVIHGILMQSRGKQGEFIPTDVKSLVHEYVWLSYHAMRASDKSFNIAIHEEYPDSLPKLMVIPQDLSRAVLNIMNNACYTVKERAQRNEQNYSPSIDIRMTISDTDDPKTLSLRIDLTDNGMGMDEETKKRLFEDFFTTKPTGEGTGLGMGIVKTIVEQHHEGKLLVESKIDEGSTFSIIIPARISR
ncbi:MAG: ATP-binding protein [Bacteroidales bacterium]|nr:ATP-binding protein [Bacteroidales bacterium]